MLPGFVQRGPLVGEDEVAAFEGRCGYRLPADYRAFLLAQNVGARSLAARIDDDTTEAWTPRPRRFYSLGAAAAAGWSIDEVVEQVTILDNVDAWTEFLTEFPELLHDLDVQMRICRGDGSHGYYPPELLPIAVGDHDDFLLLRLIEPDAGAVQYTYDPDGYCEWHCHRVAGSFAELLRDLEQVI